MGFKMDAGDGPHGDINLTPLIDVVLVLLIIFMVLTPRTIEEMSTNLPTPNKEKRDKPKDDKKDKPLVVAAYDNGELALNLKVMEKRDLAEKLRKQLLARKQDKRVVFIDAHPDVEYGAVVDVMDLVRDQGAERVGLARLKEDGPARAEEGGGGDEAGGEGGGE